MKKNFIIGILLCIIAAVLYITFENENPKVPDATTSATTESTENTEEPSIPPEPQTPSIAIINTLSGEVKDDSGEISLLKYDIETIEVSDPATELAKENINAYYENIYSKNLDFVNFEGLDQAYAEYNRLGDAFLEHLHTFRVASTYDDEKLLSVSREKLFYNGGASGVVEEIYSETFKKEDGSRVLLTDIISDTSVLTSIVTDYIKTEPSNYYENYEELVLEHFDSSRYFIESDNLVIYYATYELAPSSTDAIVLRIPFDSIVSSLTEEYKYLGEE